VSEQVTENKWVALQESGFDPEDLLMSATAYYCGRMTIQVDDHCEKLVRAWSRLSEGCRNWIQRVVEHKFCADDYARQNDLTEGSRGPLGQNCDRESWEKVRACWQSGDQPCKA
jgi:hypothetical protein